MASEREEYMERLVRRAPDRCEMCDHPLPTFSDREKHMKETKHCECFECGRYMPPGQIYVHWSILHDDLQWNDHQMAWGDKQWMREAMSWVREAYANGTGRTISQVNDWCRYQEPKAQNTDGQGAADSGDTISVDATERPDQGELTGCEKHRSAEI